MSTTLPSTSHATYLMLPTWTLTHCAQSSHTCSFLALPLCSLHHPSRQTCGSTQQSAHQFSQLRILRLPSPRHQESCFAWSTRLLPNTATRRDFQCHSCRAGIICAGDRTRLSSSLTWFDMSAPP